MRACLASVVLLALAPALGACAGTQQTMADVPLVGGGSGDVVIPNAPAGDAERRGLASASPGRQAAPLTRQQATVIAKQRLAAATELWNRAEQLDACTPGSGAKTYAKIVDDYPDYARAAEAKFREGRDWHLIYKDNDAVEALQVYMRIAPVNPHLAEVERLIFESAKRSLASRGGLFAIFKSDDIPLAALDFVARTFSAGSYADDALMTLGDYYARDLDYATAALHYKELLLRYPDSEWSFKARLRLGDTYLARDQGAPYSAGFVDIDPREGLPAEQAKMTGAVLSAAELAYEQFELYLERMQADPARLSEYREDVAYARGKLQECRERLATKDLNRGDWYAGRGERSGAITFWRQATRWTNTRAATTAACRLTDYERAGIAPAASMPATVAPPRIPPPRVTTTPQPLPPARTAFPPVPAAQRTFGTPPSPPPPPPPPWPDASR